jgi:hypothetical protein
VVYCCPRSQNIGRMDMAESPSLDVAFVAEADVIDKLLEELQLREVEGDVSSIRQIDAATDLAFDMGQLVELVTILPPLIGASTALVNALHAVFRKRPDPTKIIIKTPFHEIVFVGRPDMTEDEIRAVVTRLTTL